MIKRRERLLEERKRMAEDAEALSGDEGEKYVSEDDDDEEEEEEDQNEEMEQVTMKKNRVLTIASRGITARYRHLMKDFQQLLPHTRKEGKMDARDPLSIINEICELRSCSHAMLFDTRKHRDLYISFARCPNGPTLRFYAENIHTMDEMNLSGNCLKGSRALLSFDKNFDSEPRWKLSKEILSQMFAIPKGHPRSKPFIDHVFMFSVQDGRIWFRNYQIADQGEKDSAERSLVEIGPRIVLQPVKFFAGSFNGETIYENDDFVSPNSIVRANKLHQLQQTQANQRRSDKFHERSSAALAHEPTSMDTLWN